MERGESAGVAVQTRATLVKWDGPLGADGEPRPGQQPREVIVIEGDEIVDRWHAGDERPPPLPEV